MCSVKRETAQNKVKAPKLQLSENKKVFIKANKEIGLEAAII